MTVILGSNLGAIRHQWSMFKNKGTSLTLGVGTWSIFQNLRKFSGNKVHDWQRGFWLSVDGNTGRTTEVLVSMLILNKMIRHSQHMWWGCQVILSLIMNLLIFQNFWLFLIRFNEWQNLILLMKSRFPTYNAIIIYKLFAYSYVEYTNKMMSLVESDQKQSELETIRNFEKIS